MEEITINTQAKHTHYDVIIIGAGPGGLSSALYTSRSNLTTLVIEKALVGGELNNTDKIENYLGYKTIKGYELAEQMQESAFQFGAELLQGEVVQYSEVDGLKQVTLSNGDLLTSKAIILATGSRNRELGIPTEQEYKGRGISYCALCDGFFYTGEDIIVVGGGDSAIEEGLYLTEFAKKVTIVHRREEFRAQPMLLEQAKQHPKINFIVNTEVDYFRGVNGVEQVRLKNTVTGEEQTLSVSGAFIYVGKEPQTNYVPNHLLTDDEWVNTNLDTSTKSKGVYAVGDVRHNQLRQVATAVGDGAVAGQQVYHYIKSLTPTNEEE